MNSQRLEMARLFHRFGFGPRPGEFENALQGGLEPLREKLLHPPALDQGLIDLAELTLPDLGPYPPPNTPERKVFSQGMKTGRDALILWWLDRMALSQNALTERMVWFWHGHWATSIGKVEYPLPMLIQNQTMRANALGNFQKLSRSMILDGALQFWLDGGGSSKRAPNENLAREFMELFVLGVDRYSEADVKAAAQALTGYQVARSNGQITFNEKNHESNPLTILGSTQTLDGPGLSDLLVARQDNAQFIAERFWFRFISSTAPLPADKKITKAFAQRDISAALRATALHPAMADPQNSLVKSPVEWFIAVARALNITPSKVSNPSQIINSLTQLSQLPLYPPNVGGWPADEAWLNSASAQYRITFLQFLIKQGDITPVTSLTPAMRIQGVANWLGISAWTLRTRKALALTQGDPARVALLALCSPEFIVSI